METTMETGDQDFVEIRADEDMNDLDEDNTDFADNQGNSEVLQDATKAVERDAIQVERSQMADNFDVDWESEAEIDDAEVAEDAEEYEKELMSMPPLQSVMSDMSQLKQRRRVLVHPIKVQDLGQPKVLEVISKVSCEEIKLHFVRPPNKPEEWHGILLMHFGSTKAALQAAENLKSVRGDLNIRAREDTAYANRTMEQWVKEEKGQKRWTDTLLWVKNIPEDVTENQLLEAFPDAEDAVMHYRANKKNDSSSTKEAFIVYHNSEAALAAAKVYGSNIPSINGHPLKVFKYHMPQENVPKGLLKLNERQLVLKYLEKLASVKEQSELSKMTLPDWLPKRQEKCQNLLEKDTRIRKSAGLPTPLLEELKAQRGIRVIRGKRCKETLETLGILPPVSLLSASNKRVYSNTQDGGKPKVKSLLGLNSQPVTPQTSRPTRYQSLLGDPPPLFQPSPKPVSSQWMNSSSSNSGINALLSINPLVPQLRASSHSVGQAAAFHKQQNAMNFFSGLNQRSNVNITSGKTPLLASPVTMETTIPVLKAGASKIPLLGAEPPNKILRLDASGAFCFDFRDRGQGSNAPSRASKPMSLLHM